MYITIDEFFESEELLVIRIMSRREGTLLAEALYNSGHKWSNGKEYDLNGLFEGYKFIDNKGGKGSQLAYLDANAKMLTIDNIILDNIKRYTAQVCLKEVGIDSYQIYLNNKELFKYNKYDRNNLKFGTICNVLNLIFDTDLDSEEMLQYLLKYHNITKRKEKKYE